MPETSAKKVPDRVLMGDLSRFEFLQWLAPEFGRQNWKDEMVWVEYGEENTVIHGEKCWNVFSNRMIPRMILLVLPEEADLRQLMLKRDTCFLIFESDRFGKDSTNRLLMTLDVQRKESPKCIVLLDEKQRRASTDIDLERNAHAAERQCGQYIRSGRDALCIRPTLQEQRSQILQVLNWHESVERRWKRLMQAGLREMDAGLEWELLLDEPFQLSPENRSRIFSFEFEKKRFLQEKSLWKVYRMTSEEFLFGNGSKGLTAWAVQKYADIVPEALRLAMSDEERLRASLDAELRALFQKKMQNEGMEQICLHTVTEPSFTNLVNNSGINGMFNKRLEKYLENDVITLLEDRIKEEAKKLRGKLK